MTHKSERYFLEAIQQGQLNKMIYWIKHGHKKSTLKKNLLIYILQQQQQPQQDSLLIRKRFQIFKYLIANYNLDIHSFDSYGKNIFNWATNLNCTQEALYLLNSYPGGIDILVRDQLGSCSLHYAVEHGNKILVHAVVNYLLRYRLRFDIKDAHNNTPEDLARELGYDKISHFLSQACRSTIYMSRDIPFQQPIINEPKTTKSSSGLNPSEYFYLLETRINTAKSLGDWKTITALRAFKKNLNGKISHRLPDIIPQINTRTSATPTLQKIVPINITSQSGSQSEQMLHWLELQISPSFRPSFTPIYQQSIIPPVIFQRPSYGQCKISQASSTRIPSVLNSRKRDSDVHQTNPAMLQDLQNRLSIPPVYKQHRQSIVPTN